MPRIDLDEKDREILQCLQKNGRLSNVELAEAVNLSPSPCLRRTKRLEKKGVIRDYYAEIDRRKAGIGLTVFVEIKVDRHSTQNARELGESLINIPSVISCHMVSGNADFLAEIAARDLEDYERILVENLLTLPMISDIRSNFELREIKRHGILPI